MREKKKRRETESRQMGWKTSIIGMATSVGGILLLLGVCSVLVAWGILPEQWLGYYTVMMCGVGTFLGLYISSGGRGKGVVLYRLGMGTAVFAVLCVFGVILYGEMDTSRVIEVGVACLIGSYALNVMDKKGKRRRK